MPRNLETEPSSTAVPPSSKMVGPSIGVSAVLAAMLGLCALLCTGTLSWRDCLTYSPAWDTLLWFSGVNPWIRVYGQRLYLRLPACLPTC